MKFKKGDIVEHILTGQKILILDGYENVLVAGPIVGSIIAKTIYDARIAERLDLVYHFDEVELKEIGTEKT